MGATERLAKACRRRPFLAEAEPVGLAPASATRDRVQEPEHRDGHLVRVGVPEIGDHVAHQSGSSAAAVAERWIPSWFVAETRKPIVPLVARSMTDAADILTRIIRSRLARGAGCRRQRPTRAPERHTP